MHLSYIPLCTIQNRNVHVLVLNGALCYMGQLRCGMCVYLSRLPWIFLGAPLKVNGAPGNIQSNLIALCVNLVNPRVILCGWTMLVLSLSLWWRHPMTIFSALLAICAGNSPVTGELPAQRPVTRSFDVFFDLRLNKRLSKQSWGWWFETPSRSLWCRFHVSECVERSSRSSSVFVSWLMISGN